MKTNFTIDNKDYKLESINNKKNYSLYINSNFQFTRSFKLSSTKADIVRMFDFIIKNNLHIKQEI